MRDKFKVFLSVCVWLHLLAGTPSTAATPDEATMFRAMATEYSAPMPFFPPLAEILDVAANPDGSLVVFLALNADGKQQYFIPMWMSGQGPTGASLLVGHVKGHFTAVAFSEDGRYLYLASDEGLSVADAKTLNPIKFQKKIKDVVSLAVHGPVLYAGTSKGIVCKYRPITLEKGVCKPATRTKIESLEVVQVTTTGDAQSGLAASGDLVTTTTTTDVLGWIDDIRLLRDTETISARSLDVVGRRTVANDMWSHAALTGYGHSVSPDGAKLILRDQSGWKILDVSTGRELTKITSAGGEIQSAVFTPDGQSVVVLREGTAVESPLDLHDAETGVAMRGVGAIPGDGGRLYSPLGGKTIFYHATNETPMMLSYLGAPTELMATWDSSTFVERDQRFTLGVEIGPVVTQVGGVPTLRPGTRALKVQPDGKGAELGLVDDDVISAVNGKPIAHWVELMVLLGSISASDPVQLSVRRNNETLVLPLDPDAVQPAVVAVERAATEVPKAQPVAAEPLVVAPPAVAVVVPSTPEPAAASTKEECQQEIAATGTVSDLCRAVFGKVTLEECQSEIAATGSVSDACRALFKQTSGEGAVAQATTAQPAAEKEPETTAQTVQLALDYQYGRNGRPVDLDSAHKWFLRAAEAGDVGSMASLTRLTYGSERREWLAKAAALGSVVAIRDQIVAAWRAEDYSGAQRLSDAVAATHPQLAAALARQTAAERQSGQAIFQSGNHLLPVGRSTAGIPEPAWTAMGVRSEPSWIPAQPFSYGDRHVDEMQKKVRAFIIAPNMERDSKVFELIDHRVDPTWFWSQALLLDLSFEQAVSRMYGPPADTRVDCDFELATDWVYERGGSCREGRLFGMVRLRGRSQPDQVILGTMIHGRVVEGGRLIELRTASGAARYYVGRMFAGIPHGQGAQIYSNGRRIGKWQAGAMEGWGGSLFLENNEASKWDVPKNVRGMRALGLRYLGQYADDEYTGLGVRMDTYDFDFLMPNGRWLPTRLTYATGWQDGVAQGKGVKYYRNGEYGYCKLEYGRLLDGEMHGKVSQENLLSCGMGLSAVMKDKDKKKRWGWIDVGNFDRGHIVGSALQVISYAATSAPGDDLVTREKEKRKTVHFKAQGEKNWLQKNAGKLVAIGAGAALAGAADLSGPDTLEFLSAYTADVIGETGGTNMMGLAGSKQAATAEGNSGAAAGKPQPVEQSHQHTFTCPGSSTERSVPIVYFRPGCLSAAKDYAEVYACNVVDRFSDVAQQCSGACGNPQCLENPPGAAPPSGEAMLDDILGGN